MFKHFLVTISFLFFINFHAHAENIAIVDVNFLINNSKAGKFIQKNLTADNKKIVEELKKKETNLINEEKKLITQKNVLSEEEFKKKFKNIEKKLVNIIQKKRIN